MKTISTQKLARLVRDQRTNLRLTQDELAGLTEINRAIISRIERNDFIPSIKQLEALSRALQFEVTDLIIDETPNQLLFALRSDNYSDQEKDDVEQLTTLMMTLIQQIRLRRNYENKTHPFD